MIDPFLRKPWGWIISMVSLVVMSVVTPFPLRVLFALGAVASFMLAWRRRSG